jgi:hypothetical protein
MYSLTVTNESLERTPSWKENEENPPLAARRASQFAGHVADTFPSNLKDWKWHLDELDLRNNQAEGRGRRWYWVVHYHGRPLVEHGPDPVLYLVVLMDGRVLKPNVSKTGPEGIGPNWNPCP